MHPPHSDPRRHHRSAAACRQRLAARARDLDVAAVAGRAHARARRATRCRCGSAASAAPTGWPTISASEQIDLLIDATHPFAAQISRQRGARGRAQPACRSSRSAVPPGSRPRATAGPMVDDRSPKRSRRSARRRAASSWRSAGRRLAASKRRRSTPISIRSVDPVEPPLDVPDARYICSARGPFGMPTNATLLSSTGSTPIVCQEQRRRRPPTPRSRRRASSASR